MSSDKYTRFLRRHGRPVVRKPPDTIDSLRKENAKLRIENYRLKCATFFG